MAPPGLLFELLGGGGESRHQKHLLVRPALEHQPGERITVDSTRHDDVGDHKIDAGAVALEQDDGSVAAFGLDHAVTERGELPDHRRAHMFVVLDQEDALVADGGRRTFWPSHRGDHSSDHTRQEDAHSGAAADGARHADDGAGLMHEAVHHA